MKVKFDITLEFDVKKETLEQNSREIIDRAMTKALEEQLEDIRDEVDEDEFENIQTNGTYQLID